MGHGKHVFLVGLRPEVAAILKRLGVLEQLPDSHDHTSRLDALTQAAAMVGNS